jgi:hypothetical protein
MRRFGLVVVLAVLIITGSVLAQENQTLSLVSPQPVRSGEINASGRVISLATVRIGSRLSAYIAEWGTSRAPSRHAWIPRRPRSVRPRPRSTT